MKIVKKKSRTNCAALFCDDNTRLLRLVQCRSRFLVELRSSLLDPAEDHLGGGLVLVFGEVSSEFLETIDDFLQGLIDLFGNRSLDHLLGDLFILVHGTLF